MERGIEGWDELGIRFDINILLCVEHIASGKLLYSTGSSAWCSVMTTGVVLGCGRREAQEGGDMSILMND